MEACHSVQRDERQVMMRNIAAWIIVIAYGTLSVCDLWAHDWKTGGISACFTVANYLIFLY